MGICFTIYPNPANELLTVETDATDLKLISIITIEGKLVKTVAAEKAKQTIEVTELASGVYFIEIATN